MAFCTKSCYSTRWVVVALRICRNSKNVYTIRKMDYNMEYFCLYFDFVKIKLRSIVEYPGAFWADTIAKMMGWAAFAIIAYLMVFRFENVLSWSTYEVLFLYSINSTSYSLAGFFMYHAFMGLSNHIQNGTFDEMLTKPLNPFMYLCFKSFSTGYIANIIVTIIALIICISKLDFIVTFSTIFYLIIVLFGGALIHSGMFIFFNVPAFWIVKSESLSRFRSSLNEFIHFPISIYDKWIQVMLTFVFPLAFINFYPAQYFLSKNDFLGFSPVFMYLTPIVGIILFALGYMFFFLGIRNYKSTGS